MSTPLPSVTPTPSPADRRDGARFALKLAVSIRLPRARRAPARLLDISAGGCRVVTTAPLRPGTALWLSMGGLEARYCHVMWSHERFCGLQFAVPLEEAAFDALIADHGTITERDTTELHSLSRHAAHLARAADPAQGPHLDALARDCDEQVAQARDAAVEARRARALSRLSGSVKPATD